MIKFFRKIRQNLLMENKTSKYFKYAIGEIVLVVIGILIALQINNWNEDKKRKTLAHQYVNGLVRDLKQDTMSIKSNIQFHKELIKGLDTLIALKKDNLKDPVVVSSFYLLYRKYCTTSSTFGISESTLTQLKNTGDLALFDENIKDSIVSYELYYQNVKEQGEYYLEAETNIGVIGKKIIDYTILLDTSYFYNRMYTGKKLPKGNFTENFTREFFNETAIVRGTSKHYIISYLKPILKKAENLIEFLNKEYKLDKND